MKRGIWMVALILIWGCDNGKKYQENIGFYSNPPNYHRTVKQLTDVIVHDIFSPPVASRIYAYANIAAYETLVNAYPDYMPLAGQLSGLTPAPAPEEGKEYNFAVASYSAFLTVGKTLIFSEDKMEAYISNFYAQLKKEGIPEDVFDRSVAYGAQVAAHIMAWADKDNYKQTRTFPKYTILKTPEAWKPTPPDYMEGIEPHWNKIRTLVVDSAGQFKPEPPTKFDLTPGSKFHTEVMEVYHAVKEQDPERLAIASFWDCNPYVSHHRGHAMFATKKITPGGHWIGITSIATQQAGADLMQTVEAYTRVSIALFDGFIVCWDEKWRSILIRPETLINEYIDEDWVPVLQTPPFPEHTSGHSVISTASAITLTSLFGETFHYTDTTEREFGLPDRTFTSFIHASQEAAISRLYGGIHYMPAITEGVKQGQKVGEHIRENLITRRREVADRKDD